jgi:hypothetical protein
MKMLNQMIAALLASDIIGGTPHHHAVTIEKKRVDTIYGVWIDVAVARTNFTVPTLVGIADRSLSDDSPRMLLVELGGEYSYPVSSIERQDETNYTLSRFVVEEPGFEIQQANRLEGELIAGMQSSLVRDFNSVDFVWNTENDTKGLLVLNSSREWFNSSACYPESVMELPTSGPARVNYLDGLPDTAAIEANYVFSDAAELADIPEQLFRPIARIMRQHAGISERTVSSRLLFSFQNCAQIRTLLPTIELAFATGTIILYPDEYTRMNGNDDRCDMMITRSSFTHSSNAPHRINPLALRKMNVRFTNNCVYICDSAA